ncbi:MAG TPA: SIMPL domain-containing protein [Candidatus Limnocylindrales bacterium]|nr:SIMPL domain-containing protein [Candidatus Limnocylindrales bacterium]
MDAITLTVRLPGSRARWIAAGLATGLLVATIASPSLGPRSTLAADPTSPPQHTISVSGVGTVVVAPDVADLRLGVTFNRPTVKAARADAAAAMTKVIAALKALGIADKDIRTSTISLQPTYDYTTNTNPPRITGYSFSNGVAVTVRDLDKVGDAIDDSLAAGATTLDGVSFRVDDPAKAEQQARTDAMSQARAHADTLAAAAGVAITGVVSISETSSPTPYPIFYGAATAGAAARDVATPVQAGTTDVTITVGVVYLIG